MSDEIVRSHSLEAEVDAGGVPVKIGERHGMFGATKGQDTTGYGGLVTPTLLPGASPRPYGSYFDQVADALVASLTSRGADADAAIEKVVVDRGEMTIFVAREHILTALLALRDIEEAERAAKGAGRGDVLVFLPGERDIREISHLLRKEVGFTGEVLPLYARLGMAEQRRIFEPGGKRAGRRVVLATNVAETSLTVPGIRYVIDSGLARISSYSHRSKIQRLPVERISQASAMQRAGRCGRVAAGICYRLYSEEDFQGREAFTLPEIQRTNLSALILQMF